MAQANLRNSGADPYLYLEGNSGSSAVGIVGATDVFNIVVVPSASDIEPDSGSPSISIDPSTNGDIEFRPKGVGKSTFVNGDVAISAGNLNMTNTAVAGTTGVIHLGGNRFVHNKGTDNTFVGSLAGNLGTTGNSSVAVGTNALQSDASLTGMTAVGFDALTDLTAGICNTAVGYKALASATSANQNTAVGYNSLTALTAPGIGGGLNAAFGNHSLHSSTLGRFNTAIGCQALNAQNGNGNNDIYNTAVGIQAGWSMTSGINNTLIGAQAGVATLLGSGLLTGDWNVIVGAHSGQAYTSSESSNVLIGNEGTVGESNTIRLGTPGGAAGQQNKAFVAGVASTSITATGVVGVSSTGQLGGSNGSNGQLLIGGGSGPVWANITSTGGTIIVSNGANTINLERSGPAPITWSQVT